MPCQQVFETCFCLWGLLISLGFSVQAEPAHRNQGSPAGIKRWYKALLPITHTAGDTTFISLRTARYLRADIEHTDQLCRSFGNMFQNLALMLLRLEIPIRNIERG